MSDTVVVNGTNAVVTVEASTETIVTVTPAVTTILTVGTQGPVGATGSSGGGGGGGGSDILSYIANASLGGNRAVKFVAPGIVDYASSATAGDAAKAVGITTGAALSGASISVQVNGEMVDSSWAWTAGAPVYLGIAGALTQTVPTSGFILQVGIASSVTSLVIDVKQSVVLL